MFLPCPSRRLSVASSVPCHIYFFCFAAQEYCTDFDEIRGTNPAEEALYDHAPVFWLSSFNPLESEVIIVPHQIIRIWYTGR